MIFEDFDGLTPINFFALKFDVHRYDNKQKRPLPKKSLAPDTHGLCGEEAFAQVALGWCDQGIRCDVCVDKPVMQSFYPLVERGDAVELFFDTRDLKGSGFNTRFCHHFFFLPKEVDGVVAGEVTRFRTEDAHDLCDHKALQVTCKLKKMGYDLKIFIPSHCFVGYDPSQFDRLGFSYRISRLGGKAQHLTVVSEDYAVDQQPSLWSSVRMVS